MKAVERASGYSFLKFADSVPARADGVLYKNGEIVALVEIKVRDTTLKQVEKWGSWLITKEKIDILGDISQHLQLPLIGVLATLQDRKVRVALLTDEDNKLKKIPYMESRTQESINGGNTIRENYLIPYKMLKNPRAVRSMLG